MSKRIILTVATILWMLAIFMFSNQKADQSTERSRSLVTNTIVRIYKFFDSNASEEKIESIVDKLDHPVRKIAHFTEYFISDAEKAKGKNVAVL